MKNIFILIFFLIFSKSNAFEIKLEKIVDDLDRPWSLSFIDQNNIIFTEKSGKLYNLNLKDREAIQIKHNLSVLEDGQGGLLDVLHHEGQIYISYSENRGNWRTSTSVAK